jgi:hypothetical protein
MFGFNLFQLYHEIQIFQTKNNFIFRYKYINLKKEYFKF